MSDFHRPDYGLGDYLDKRGSRARIAPSRAPRPLTVGKPHGSVLATKVGVCADHAGVTEHYVKPTVVKVDQTTLDVGDV